jgi:hypothetical protein
VKNDPLVRLPGTQPFPEGDVVLEAPTRCLNCHADYNTIVEPGFNWKGSMMAQSARDFVFWACMAVAGQDSAWAIGTPNAVDICERCHFPQGWLEGRSDPPNASAMVGSDFDGVHCDFCHRAYDPFFEDTFSGVREGSDQVYWDETNLSGTPSDDAATAAYQEDVRIAADISLFNEGAKDLPFFKNNQPPDGYNENGSGQYFISPTRDKRASFADAEARHGMYYSRYHKSKYFCGICHDVSNPVLANLGAAPGQPLPTESNSAYSYFHVERTFSEFMLSDYGLQGGSPGKGPFDPAIFETSLPDNAISKCQDCHMRDGVGAGCDKKGVPIRPDQSIEHPGSGQPIHDLTGGNIWVPTVLASSVQGSPNYDPVNGSLLNQGPAVLTLDLTAGEGLDPAALLAGADRSRQQLQLAASITDLEYFPASGDLHFRVQNQTGHKLISGFPEGRRMFLNIKVFKTGSLIQEVNPYDESAGTLKGLSYNYQADPLGKLPKPLSLAANEIYVDDLVYEMHPSSTLTGEQETFHFALADNRYKDNRIPPKGFRIGEASERLSVPRSHGADAPGYFTAAEYSGGYDEVQLQVAPDADHIEVSLYYQTTSREYMEFLRDEINGNPNNQTLPAGAYIIQSDPFFSGMKAWGNTIWELWTHNMNLDGAAPYLMTQAVYGSGQPLCTAESPVLFDAVAGNGSVTLNWTDMHTGNQDIIGYKIYYDQSGKAQFVDNAGLATSYTDTGLTNGSPYCYQVVSYTADCDSDFSNILCAIPSAGNGNRAGAQSIVTGILTKSGKGKNTTTVFTTLSIFSQGDEVVFRIGVVDVNTGSPLEGATVQLQISGPEVAFIESTASDTNGIAEARWKTQAPNRKGNGGTSTGDYSAAVSDITASGYVWDGVIVSTAFIVQ